MYANVRFFSAYTKDLDRKKQMRVTPWLAGLFFLALPVLAAPRHRDPAEWRSSRIVRDTVEVRDSLAAADSVLSGELPGPTPFSPPRRTRFPPGSRRIPFATASAIRSSRHAGTPWTFFARVPSSTRPSPRPRTRPSRSSPTGTASYIIMVTSASNTRACSSPPTTWSTT